MRILADATHSGQAAPHPKMPPHYRRLPRYLSASKMPGALRGLGLTGAGALRGLGLWFKGMLLAVGIPQEALGSGWTDTVDKLDTCRC